VLSPRAHWGRTVYPSAVRSFGDSIAPAISLVHSEGGTHILARSTVGSSKLPAAVSTSFRVSAIVGASDSRTRSAFPTAEPRGTAGGMWPQRWISTRTRPSPSTTSCSSPTGDRAGPRHPLSGRPAQLPSGEVQRQQKAAEAALMQTGITFAVYDSEEGADRIFPFDMVRRIVVSYAYLYRTETIRSSRIRSQTCNGHGMVQR